MYVFRLRRLKLLIIILTVVTICSFLVLLLSLTKEERRETPKQKILSDPLTIPSKSELNSLPHRKLASLYHTYISTLQWSCDKILRLGEETDGGWEVCDDVNFRPRTRCLVYSFGIDNDFSFDDAVAMKYGCEVHSFDPSMTLMEKERKPNSWFHPFAIGPETRVQRGNNWKMFTIRDLKEKLGHQGKTLNVLKLDIEEWEMLSLPRMIGDNSLSGVQQLLIEFHITTRPEPNKQRYIQGLDILKDLYDLGFRIFWTKRNLFCRFTSLEGDIERTGCHEVCFVNIHK